jgi:serine/threonine protein kinase
LTQQRTLTGCGNVHLSTSSGQLKKDPIVFHWSLKSRIDDLKVVTEEEAAATASFVERCLRLNPEHRPTAAELLTDSWFDGVE